MAKNAASSAIRYSRSFFKQQVFDTVVEEVNKLKPDAIIITGDLTDEGLLFQFEYIHAQIKKFTCSNIIVLTGNHDYRTQDIWYSRSSFHQNNKFMNLMMQ